MPTKVMMLLVAIVLLGSVTYPQTATSRVAQFEVASITRNLRSDGALPVRTDDSALDFVVWTSTATLVRRRHAQDDPWLRSRRRKMAWRRALSAQWTARSCQARTRWRE